MATKKVAILGAGDMGHGIAELAALHGYDVRLRDIAPEILAKARDKIAWSLAKLAEKSTITADAASAALARVSTTTDLAEAVRDADFVIEAIPEKLELKQSTFAEVERLAPPHAVLASNTSTMRMADVGGRMKDPTRLVGMHFFNPVLLMTLVEVIPGERTRPDVVAETTKVAQAMGKTVVVCHRDSPGFITSRLIGTWVGAAVKLYEEKAASPEQIDSALKFQAGFPMGPFELADYTGLDIGHHAANYIAAKLGPHYQSLPAIRDRVAAGQLGKKTGRGFYEWKDGRNTTKISAETGQGFDPTPVLATTANEAVRCLEEGLGSADEIDAAMRLGCAFPKGPLEWADAAGLDVVLRTLETLHAAHPHPMFEPHPRLVRMVREGSLGRKAGAGFYSHAATAGAAASWKTLVVEVGDDGVGVLALNRPHRLHAISAELVEELARASAAMDRDDRVRCVLVTATGDKAFCAGADLSEAGEITPPVATEIARGLNQILLGWERSPKVYVAALNGAAYGGGFEIALGCDLRVAARRARMGLTEVTLGLIAASGGTQRLPKLVGLSRAKEIVLLGEKHDAQRMLEWGVLHRVFENDAFGAEARAFAARIAKGAPVAQRLAKRALNMASTTTSAEGAEFEAAAFGLLISTEDAIEGVASMFQRTEPQFKGK